MPETSRYHSVVVYALLFVLIGLAFSQRLAPIRHWETKPSKHLVNGEPMLTNFDGYYYLAAAQDILDGTYNTIETYRAWPDRITRSSVPPLLSCILAGGSWLTGISLNRIGVFLPCLFSLALAVPVFYLGRRWADNITGLIAGGLALLSPYYASRSGLGVLDTDCLNVFFSLSAVCLALLAGTAKGRAKIWWAAACLVNYGLFLWWWDQTCTAPTILCAGAMAVCILMYYRPGLKGGLIAAGILTAAVLLVGMVAGFDYFTHFIKSVWGSLSYISKQEIGLYPNVGKSISEQGRMTVGELAALTIMVPTCFHLAVFGLVWLLASRKKEAMILIPLIAISAFSVLFARRFAIFTVPVVALGFSFFIYKTAGLFSRRNRTAGIIAMTLGVVYCVWAGYTFYHYGVHRASFYPAPTIAGMQSLKTRTPENAVIWSWWEEGHPLVYWGRRTTLGDGMIHGGERNHCLAFPLAASRDRMAANFMQFYAVRGIKGRHWFFNEAKQFGLDGERLLPEILGAGPENIRGLTAGVPEDKQKEWAAFLFPDPSRPVYLFLTRKMMRSKYWILTNAAWDTKTGTAPRHLPSILYKLPGTLSSGAQLPSWEHFSVDPVTRMLTLPAAFKAPVPLHRVMITRPEKTINVPGIAPYPGNVRPTFQPTVTMDENTSETGDYDLDINLVENLVLLQDAKTAQSLMNRLFWRASDYNPKYFEPVVLETPFYQIWKVGGDRL